MSSFETRLAAELAPQPEEQRWLVEHLWGAQAVGVVGGAPKCCKSFLALQLSVAIASGTPCLRRFATQQPGRVLLYAAEDALHIVRERLHGLARAANLEFNSLDIHVITAPAVRLDLDIHRQRLKNTVARVRPVMLVLDPFVRLHRCDENTAAEVAPMLAFLRELQRGFETAVLLVHHARKAGHSRAGQALRGSSEIHAWGDSNLYLRRTKSDLLLSVEHRAAPAIDEIALELSTHKEGAVALCIIGHKERTSAAERIERALAGATAPMSLRAIRAACGMRMATVSAALKQMKSSGRIVDHDNGYTLA
jgi:RecA-family ATPase